jgi:ABC-type sugar transport system ATPase subunit
MGTVTLQGARKRFGKVEVIHGVDLEVARGEFCVLVGPSGCGKSTLLRMIAGLEEISAGRLFIGGREVTDLPPAERGVSMVFQSYALYPHMTVFKNMAFGLKLAKADTGTIEDKVRAAARTLQIEDLLERKPRELSGGQRQRVAIGRAIVRDPQVFLFDEPLSNLDAALRVQMRVEIGRLHERLGATMVYVTHDQVEAMTLADKIVVLNAGRVEQVGAPIELYRAPRNLFVAGFIGAPAMNLLAGRVADGGVALEGGAQEGGTVARVPTGGLEAGQAVTLGLRPEHLHPAGEGQGIGLTFVPEMTEELGESRLLHGRLESGPELTVRLHGRQTLPHGRPVPLAVDPEDAHLFDADGQRVEGAMAAQAPPKAAAP